MVKPTTLKDIYNAVITYIEGHTGVRYTPPFRNYDESDNFCSISKDNNLYIKFERVKVQGQFAMCMKEIGLTIIVKLPDELPEKLKKNPFGYMEEIVIPTNKTGNIFVDASFRWYHYDGGSNGDSAYFLFKDGNIFNVRLGV